MRIEKGKDKIIFLSGFIIAVVLIILINIFTAKASYRKTESIPLAKGTINYSLADLNIIAMYQEKDEYTDETDKYEITEQIPGEGFVLSDKSYCEIDKEKEENIKIEYKDNLINVLGLTKKGTKCYIYFESISSNTLAKLGEFKKEKAPASYSGSDTEDHGNLLYYTEDNDGTSYFFRGAAKNNWVKFGTNDTGDKDIWWRIIRINGDGTIRLIYTGMYNKDTNPEPEDKAYVTGEETLVATTQEFSGYELYRDNTYVGFYYGTEGGTNFDDTHSNTTPNNVANKLKEWYEGPNWNEIYNQYIDENAGFCNDRTKPENGTHGSSYTQEGYGNNPTIYGPLHRLTQSGSKNYDQTQEPTLKCGELELGQGVSDKDYQRDLYTINSSSKGNGVLEVPVGLITADEVVFAGGFGDQNNTDYYLCNNKHFWTMSPAAFDVTTAAVFAMNANGLIGTYGANDKYSSNNDKGGVRPVINLKADTLIKTNGNDSKGTIDNPYVVVTE